MRGSNILPTIILAFSSTIYAQATSNTAFWFEPGANITKYSASVVVPNVSSGSGVHGVWPGIENDAGTYVFQSVIADSKTPGAWMFWVEYCCNADYQATPIKVFPGDTITSTFTLTSSSYWTDSWTLSPGSTGLSNGQYSQTGSSGNTYTGASIIDKVLMAIELQSGGVWDFGQVVWSSISVTAVTSKQWCSTGYATSGGLTYSISSGASMTSGGEVTCTYGKVTFG